VFSSSDVKLQTVQYNGTIVCMVILGHAAKPCVHNLWNQSDEKRENRTH